MLIWFKQRWLGKRVPLQVYQPLFRETADALQALVETPHFDHSLYDSLGFTSSDFEAFTEAVNEYRLTLGPILARLSEAVTQLERVKPEDRQLRDLHTHLLWVARGYGARFIALENMRNLMFSEMSNKDLSDYNKTKRQLGWAEGALGNNVNSLLSAIESLREVRPDLLRSLGIFSELEASLRQEMADRQQAS